MAKSLPKYVEDRIRRQASPGCCVVKGSTPVVSFGHAQNATVATLGLNPSKAEFLDGNRKLLAGKERRLATSQSLGVDSLTSADRRVIRQVLDDCNDYFKVGHNPYWRWFQQLTPILHQCGASYDNGTACHLDLVQWATDPTWGGLPRAVGDRLIGEDAAFLKQQLKQEQLRILLVNGQGVLRQLRRAFGSELVLSESSRVTGLAHVDTRLFGGRIFGNVSIVAWTTNVQSSFGVTNELRQELARRVASLVA